MTGFVGVEQGTVDLLTSGIHFMQVEMMSRDSSDFALSTSVRLRPFNDPDDGKVIAVGETITGSIDHLSDWDWYSIRLTEGETVKILTDSFNVGTVVYVDFPGARSNQVAYASESDSGQSETGSEVVYRAPHAGEYFLAIIKTEVDSFGGYYLSVERARPGTETVTVPKDPGIVFSPFGRMVIFEDHEGYISVQVPEAWIEYPTHFSYDELFYAYDPETLSQLQVLAEDVHDWGRGDLTLDQYVELIETSVLLPSGYDEITKQVVQTVQGVRVVELASSFFDDRVVQFIYVSDENIAFTISLWIPKELSDWGDKLADYIIDTFRVN